MKKNDIILIAVLVGLLMLWPKVDQYIIKPLVFKRPAVEVFPEPEPEPAPETESAALPVPAAVVEAAPSAPAVLAAPEPESEEAVPEEMLVLENEYIRLELSSHGGGIASVTIKTYRQTLDTGSDPVHMEFSSMRPFEYSASRAAFRVENANDREAVLTLPGPGGLVLTRTYELGERYDLSCTEVWRNPGGEAAVLPPQQMELGAMQDFETGPVMKGLYVLGVDTLSPGGEKVRYWGKKIGSLFKDEVKEKRLEKLPEEILLEPRRSPVDWVAVKNKYFVQILAPEGGAEGFTLYARRELDPREIENPSFAPRMQPLKEAGALIHLPEVVVAAGGEFRRAISGYIGPKKYDELAGRGMDQVEVMEFGMWAPVGKLLLKIMNSIHRRLWPHNYGLAIILLTIIIRVVFWPITHKSTESMKKMSEIQPQVALIREKYKDNPQKMQQATMALYKENKVNPVGGCLPMLIQIPVFIALFVVLRSAIELRFASFLWIRDLSQAENLLAGVLPIPLNILPLVMAATMWLQQKMTPQAGDPQQQKVMAFMPVMMLFLFYKMASGLVLYWTTNQCLMILQQFMMKRKQAKKA
ncbi:MAG TPA: membrane protein insertase YidC [Kiritimatiellia bacterium]|nr:membrane protein insertase YidC [Kiritimatiellia bacterium]